MYSTKAPWPATGFAIRFTRRRDERGAATFRSAIAGIESLIRNCHTRIDTEHHPHRNAEWVDHYYELGLAWRLLQDRLYMIEARQARRPS
jgi:hypothetical protein